MVFLKSALSRITQFVATLSTSMHHRGSINAAVRSDDPAIIVPHLSPTNPEDDTMRALNRNIPVSVQHFVRDKGVMRFLADNSALMAAATLGASQPSLLYRFMDAGKCMKNYKYGDIKGQNCQVFNFDAYTSETAASASPASTTTATSTAAGTISTTIPATTIPVAATGAQTGSGAVLVLVHGGAWGSGKPWMYRLMALGMAKCLKASSCIVVQYPLYPECVISGQADSVYEAMRYIKWNEKKLGLPEGSKIILAGHSSGANICALALLKSSANNEKIADCFIGMSGVYNIENHYNYEKIRGAHEFSPMSVAAISPDRWWESSPTMLLPRMVKDKIIAYWPPTLLVHGVTDSVVPYSSSQDFAEQLIHQGASVTTSYPPLSAHADCIFEFTNPVSGAIGEILKKYYSSLNFDNSRESNENQNSNSKEVLQKLTLKSKL